MFTSNQVSTSQVNASLALGDRLAFGVYTTEADGLSKDGGIKSVLLQWVLQPVFGTDNKLTFFRLSYISPKGKNKGEYVESARLQPSKATGFTVTFQDARPSTVKAIASFTSLEAATEFVSTNVLPPSFFQLAYVYQNASQSLVTDDLDTVRTLTPVQPIVWKTAIETGNRLLPQFFKPAIAASPEVATPATPATPEVATPSVTVRAKGK